MPFFRVMLAGSGISYPCTDGSLPAIGFLTTRDVRASSLQEAERKAKELVLVEWRSGGKYFSANQGACPSITVEESFQLTYLRGIFARKPSGYSFYTHE